MCRSKSEYENVSDIWNYLFDAPYDKIEEKTGCVRKCNFIKYEIVKQETVRIDWNTTKWISEFYLFTDSENVEIRTEYYPYDVRDLIGAVGGYFGKLSRNQIKDYMHNF